MDYLEINNLTFTYFNERTKLLTPVFNNVSLNIPLESTTVIIGEIGAGKSTLLKIISGTLPYDSGTIFYKGLDLDKIYIEDRNFSYISQNVELIPKKTVFDNLAIPLLCKRIKKDIIREKIYKISQQFSIDFLLSRKPNELSIGQIQKINFAKSLLKDPDLFLLDEPFSNLDNESRIDLRANLKKYTQENKTSCILVTHNIEDALYLGDYIIVLKEGEIKFSGTKQKAINTNNIYVRELLDAEINFKNEKE